MRRIIIVLTLLLVAILIMACMPITIEKCTTDYTYRDDKVASEYKECITQVPEKIPPIHLKHADMYE